MDKLLIVQKIYNVRPRVNLLENAYGPAARSLRAETASIVLGRKVNQSAKETQWNNWRDLIFRAFGCNLENRSIAGCQSQFEESAFQLMGMPTPDAQREENLRRLGREVAADAD